MRRSLPTGAALTTLLVGLLLVGPQCSAGGDKDASGVKDAATDGLVADAEACGYCLATLYVPCDGGKAGTAVECAPRACVPKLGCRDCNPGTNTCVANTIHTCESDGTPGPKVADCDPGKGELCNNGECKKACDVAAGSPSNVGCEFWAVDLDNEYSAFNDAAGAPWGVVLSNASDFPATVTIERNDALPGAPLKTAVVKTLSIKAGELAKVVLPTREVDGSVLGKDDGPGTFLSSNAYRITSTAPLVAYQFNPMEQTFSNDASLLLPRNGLGKIHRVLGFPTANPIAIFPTPGIPDHSYVTIVGVEPGTKVKVTLGGPIVKGGAIPATPKGGVVEATLGPFDVLNLESDGVPGDLTGTIVESSAPVSVFSGGERGIAPLTDGLPKPPGWTGSDKLCCTDHLEEQVFPVTAMGKQFVITRSPIRSTSSFREPDILRFLGVAETAEVTTNLPAPFDKFTLAPGQMKETWTDRDIVVSSTQPLAIGQILVSQTYVDGPYTGDPSLTIFPPVEQYRNNYLFLVPSSWAKNYVVIAARVGGKVQIDGKDPGGCVVEPAGKIGAIDYEARRCPVTEGARRLTGDQPFGVIAYGYGPAGSYAFSGGADVKNIYTPPPLK